MVSAGVIRADDRVELIRGVIVQMSPQGGPHVWVVDNLNQVFVTRLSGRARVSVQNNARLRDSMPQPDLMLLRRDMTPRTVPTPADVLLIVEVSDTTLRDDLADKVPLYADNGIVETWIVDVAGERIRVFRNPRDGAYTQRLTVGRGQTVTPLAFRDVGLSVDEILD